MRKTILHLLHKIEGTLINLLTKALCKLRGMDENEILYSLVDDETLKHYRYNNKNVYDEYIKRLKAGTSKVSSRPVFNPLTLEQRPEIKK